MLLGAVAILMGLRRVFPTILELTVRRRCLRDPCLEHANTRAQSCHAAFGGVRQGHGQ